jgi:hypothetical protein
MSAIQQALLAQSSAAIISAQHWRVFVSTGNGGGNVSIVELEFLDATPSVISTAGGTASSSTAFSGSFLAAKGFDGLLTSTTRWASNSLTNCWLGMAFSGTVTPRTAKIYPYANVGSQNDCPRDFQFQYSTDNVNWNNIGPAYTGYVNGWVQYTARSFTIQ